MTTKTPVNLADLARSFHLLQPEDFETERRIADLLGFEALPIALPSVGAPGPKPEPVQPTPSPTPAVESVSPPPRPAPLPSQVGPKEVKTRVALSFNLSKPESVELPETPNWARIKPSGQLQQPAAMPAPAALFLPTWARTTFVRTLSTSVLEGRLDILRLVDLVARLEVPTELPRLPWATMRRGVQVLIDDGKSMAPFRQDQYALLAELEKLAGSSAFFEAYLFRGTPKRWARTWMTPRDVESSGEIETYVLPPPGTPILALTDLGIGALVAGEPYVPPKEWAVLAQQCRAAGNRLIAYVPYGPGRWPESLRSEMELIHWHHPRDGFPSMLSINLSSGGKSWHLIAALARRNEQAAALAHLASLATRVEPALLRELRLKLLPEADGSAEADLWFSPLVSARSERAFLLRAGIADTLRRSLRQQNATLFEKAWEVVCEYRQHTGARRGTLVEEEINYWLSKGGEQAQIEVSKRLQDIVATIYGQGVEDGFTLWSVELLGKLPEDTRTSEAGQTLGMAAGLRLGGESLLAQLLPQDLGGRQWLVPISIRQRKPTSVWVGREPAGLVFGSREDLVPAGKELDKVPDTTPLVLWLSWDGGKRREKVSLTPGKKAGPIPTGDGEVTIETFTGIKWTLTPSTAQAPVAETPGAYALPPILVRMQGDEAGLNLVRAVLEAGRTDKGRSLLVRELTQQDVATAAESAGRERPTDRLATLILIARDGRYLIRYTDDCYSSRVPTEQGYSQLAAQRAVESLEHAARWVQVVQLDNKTTSLPPDAVVMELYAVKDSDALGERFDTTERSVRLEYRQQDGNSIQPRFKLKLTNNTDQRLYCALLDLTETFAVRAAGLLKGGGEWLEPSGQTGSEVWAYQGKPIPAAIPKVMLDQGVVSFRDILKLIVSTTEVPATLLERAELGVATRGAKSPEKPVSKSSLARLYNQVQTGDLGDAASSDETITDWTTSQVTITTVHPPRDLRLRVSLKPADAELQAQLEASPLLEVISSTDPDADVEVIAQPDGGLILGNDTEPLLAAVPTGETQALRAGLEHYYRYNTVLRMARNFNDPRLNYSLSVQILDSNDQAALATMSQEELADPALPEAPRDADRIYAIPPGFKFCAKVTNNSSYRLYVTLLNCSAGGLIEYLSDALVRDRSAHVMWLDNKPGASFEIQPDELPAGHHGVSLPMYTTERMIAIGTTQHDVDLRYLTLDKRVQEVVDENLSRRGERPVRPAERTAAPPAEQWTAAITPIRVLRGEPEEAPALAQRPGGVELASTLPRLDIDISAQNQVTMHFGDPATGIPPNLGQGALALPAALPRPEDELDAYGRALRDALLADTAVRDQFQNALITTVRATPPRPLRIHLGLSAESKALHNLAWETLLDPLDDQPLLSHSQVYFSRFLQSDQPIGTPPVQPRALVFIANPERLAKETIVARDVRLHPVDVTGELARARQGLGPLVPEAITSVPGQKGTASLDRLLSVLGDSSREPCHVLYLVCHGAIYGGRLQLWLDQQDDKPVDAQLLVDGLRDLDSERRPRLVVLPSCQSAGLPGTGNQATVDRGALAALGPKLVQEAGIAAVVAMQGNIFTGAVEVMMPAFFQELVRSRQVDRAMALARGRMRIQADPLFRGQWWVPVLFTSLSSGLTFESASPDARQEIPRQPSEPEMILIPAGEFRMGSGRSKRLSLPEYAISKYPVTNQQYAEFVQQTGYQPGGYRWRLPPGKENQPATLVSWHDANAFCRWLSSATGRQFRLPTEAEWEKAARGSDIHTDSPDWTSSLYRPYPYKPDDGREDPEAAGPRVVRSTVTSRHSGHPNSRNAYYGFRVAATAPLQP